jgi:predicted transposase YbfD/YdcC
VYSTAASPDVSHGEEECDITGLLEMLGTVKDPRKRRGRMYGLQFVLAAVLVAVLAEASNFRQVADHIADLPQSLLRRLGARWCHYRMKYGYPSERTIRRLLCDVDADELDRAAGAWLCSNVEADVDGVMALAIDGKVLRGSWTDENQQFTLFSAMVQKAGVTIAQVEVPAGTNEITQVENLLEAVPVVGGKRVVVTADAAHTQRDTAKHIKEVRGFDYFLQVKGNQPNLLGAVFEKVSPLLTGSPGHSVTERGHGRINVWDTWATDAVGIDFPFVMRAACIRRKVFTLAGECQSKELAWVLSSAEATAEDFHTYVRSHWGIENKSHYIRDTTWSEDAHQAYVGNGPRVMATMRNLAIGILRLNGISDIKRTVEGIARDRRRALPLLSLRSVAGTT